MDAPIVGLVAVEIVLGAGSAVYHLRNPFTGRVLYVWRFGMGCAALSLLCFTAALLLAVPESRGVLVMLSLIALGVLAERQYHNRERRSAAMHVDTEAAQQPAQSSARPQQASQVAQAQPDISSYTVRTHPQTAHGGVRSARVRRIQGMGESYGDD